MKAARLLICLFGLWSLVTSAQAITVSASSMTSSGSLTMAYNEGPNKMEWSRTSTNDSTSRQVWVKVGKVAASGSTSFLSVEFETGSPLGTTSSGGAFTPPADQWYCVEVYVWNGFSKEGTNHGWVQAKAAPPTYGVTFHLPTNWTTQTIDYLAMQAGNQVGWTRQASGASARDWYVGNLSSNAPVILVQITGGDVAVDEAGNLGAIPGETDYAPASPSTTPTLETAPGSGATANATGAPPTAPAPTNPPTEAPAAPTPTTAPTAPTATTPGAKAAGPTPFSPSGTGGVSKADAEAIANKQNEAVDAVASTVKNVGDATVEAVGKVASAVWEASKTTATGSDKVAGAVWESGKAGIEATNKVSAAVDKARGEITNKLGTLINAINGGEVTPASYVNPSTATAAWDPTADGPKVAATIAKLPTAPSFGGVTSASTISVNFEVPKLSGGSFVVNKTVDFSAAPYSGPIAVFRGIIQVVMTLIFFLATFYTVRGALASK